ncbi:3'-5' exonuclease [Planobacterium oryzisoli]|uniref:3'-5' exonuclease n=1 Tax=Planobacterium oryzisoli TaxID=2771435 RepID=A0A930YXA1_9FLAO|nr:3'-5' exonuclease [Planobacterium oryzisoli]MBF5027960.1 3'-5' exonuclease [Planobacterium oryzisoli]
MYSIIDIEGNGAAYRKESIIEIAIYRYDGRKITDQFISLVNPEAEITSFVQKLTGISPAMVRSAPKFHEIARRVLEITEGTTLVGHNIEYDYRMLRQSFKRLGYDYKIETLDTIPLSQELLPEAESYALGKLVKDLGIPLTDHHRAAGDARATLDLFKVLMSKDRKNEIIQKLHEKTNANTYVNKVRDLTQDLPGEKGIVYFQNAAGTILYSNYVDDINKAAKKLLHSKAKRLEKVQKDSEQIHYELVGGELTAALLLLSKGILDRAPSSFGLYTTKKGLSIERKTPQRKTAPLLEFKSYTQGLKAYNYIKSRFSSTQELISFLDLSTRTELWTFPGRILGESAFLVLKQGQAESFGFFELHTQINTLAKIQSLSMELPPEAKLENLLKMALLKGEIHAMGLPE